MGREIRKVPPNWEHPKYTAEDHRYGEFAHRIGQYRPMFDEPFEKAAAEWKAGFAAWERGERSDYCKDESRELEYWEYEGEPPDRAYYRPYKDEEATWFQVYETVSEGTPVTPPFATKEELIDYLAANGDFWDQKRGDGPWKREAAARFVKDEWAPSMMVQTGPEGAQIFQARDGFPTA